jgi:hypothetical protein
MGSCAGTVGTFPVIFCSGTKSFAHLPVSLWPTGTSARGSVASAFLRGDLQQAGKLEESAQRAAGEGLRQFKEDRFNGLGTLSSSFSPLSSSSFFLVMLVTKASCNVGRTLYC